MNKKQLDKSVGSFNNLIQKIQYWQGGFALILLLMLSTVWYFSQLTMNLKLFVGLVVVGSFLLIEAFFYIFNPHHFSNKYGSCKQDILDFQKQLNLKTKITAAIFSVGVLSALVCVFYAPLKDQISLTIPFIVLGSLHLLKWQIITYRCWVLEDEFNRLREP